MAKKKLEFTLIRVRRRMTAAELRDHKLREWAALVAVTVALAMEVIGGWRGQSWPFYLAPALVVASMLVYFHVSVSVSIPFIERWKARRRER